MTTNNPYTLITGASQGFGKALALECASRKMNVILVSLPNSGLIELTDYINSNYPVDAIPYEIDLCNLDDCKKMVSQIIDEKLPVHYLINNAGMLSKGYFEDLTLSYCEKMIQLNITTPTILIKLLLPLLKENEQAGILNVGSLASFFHLPKKQIYGGTKAYLMSFSQSLGKELKEYHINVSMVCPGGLNTNTQITYQNRTGGFFSKLSILDAEVAAKHTIKGMLNGKTIIVPGKLNQFFLMLNRILPNSIKQKITSLQMKKLKGSRAYV